MSDETKDDDRDYLGECLGSYLGYEVQLVKPPGEAEPYFLASSKLDEAASRTPLWYLLSLLEHGRSDGRRMLGEGVLMEDRAMVLAILTRAMDPATATAERMKLGGSADARKQTTAGRGMFLGNFNNFDTSLHFMYERASIDCWGHGEQHVMWDALLTFHKYLVDHTGSNTSKGVPFEEAIFTRSLSDYHRALLTAAMVWWLRTELYFAKCGAQGLIHERALGVFLGRQVSLVRYAQGGKAALSVMRCDDHKQPLFMASVRGLLVSGPATNLQSHDFRAAALAVFALGTTPEFAAMPFTSPETPLHSDDKQGFLGRHLGWDVCLYGDAPAYRVSSRPIDGHRVAYMDKLTLYHDGAARNTQAQSWAGGRTFHSYIFSKDASGYHRSVFQAIFQRTLTILAGEAVGAKKKEEEPTPLAQVQSLFGKPIAHVGVTLSHDGRLLSSLYSSVAVRLTTVLDRLTSLAHHAQSGMLFADFYFDAMVTNYKDEYETIRALIVLATSPEIIKYPWTAPEKPKFRRKAEDADWSFIGHQRGFDIFLRKDGILDADACDHDTVYRGTSSNIYSDMVRCGEPLSCAYDASYKAPMLRALVVRALSILMTCADVKEMTTSTQSVEADSDKEEKEAEVAATAVQNLFGKEIGYFEGAKVSLRWSPGLGKHLHLHNPAWSRSVEVRLSHLYDLFANHKEEANDYFRPSAAVEYKAGAHSIIRALIYLTTCREILDHTWSSVEKPKFRRLERPWWEFIGHQDGYDILLGLIGDVFHFDADATDNDTRYRGVSVNKLRGLPSNTTDYERAMLKALIVRALSILLASDVPESSSTTNTKKESTLPQPQPQSSDHGINIGSFFGCDVYMKKSQDGNVQLTTVNWKNDKTENTITLDELRDRIRRDPAMVSSAGDTTRMVSFSDYLFSPSALRWHKAVILSLLNSGMQPAFPAPPPAPPSPDEAKMATQADPSDRKFKLVEAGLFLGHFLGYDVWAKPGANGTGYELHLRGSNETSDLRVFDTTTLTGSITSNGDMMTGARNMRQHLFSGHSTAAEKAALLGLAVWGGWRLPVASEEEVALVSSKDKDTDIGNGVQFSKYVNSTGVKAEALIEKSNIPGAGTVLLTADSTGLAFHEDLLLVRRDTQLFRRLRRWFNEGTLQLEGEEPKVV